MTRIDTLDCLRTCAGDLLRQIQAAKESGHLTVGDCSVLDTLVAAVESSMRDWTEAVQ